MRITYHEFQRKKEKKRKKNEEGRTSDAYPHHKKMPTVESMDEKRGTDTTSNLEGFNK